MKAVITAAGLGTRLLSVTKELPKEMLPLFSRSRLSRSNHSVSLTLSPVITFSRPSLALSAKTTSPFFAKASGCLSKTRA